MKKILIIAIAFILYITLSTIIVDRHPKFVQIKYNAWD